MLYNWKLKWGDGFKRNKSHLLSFISFFDGHMWIFFLIFFPYFFCRTLASLFVSIFIEFLGLCIWYCFFIMFFYFYEIETIRTCSIFFPQKHMFQKKQKVSEVEIGK